MDLVRRAILLPPRLPLTYGPIGLRLGLPLPCPAVDRVARFSAGRFVFERDGKAVLETEPEPVEGEPEYRIVPPPGSIGAGTLTARFSGEGAIAPFAVDVPAPAPIQQITISFGPSGTPLRSDMTVRWTGGDDDSVVGISASLSGDSIGTALQVPARAGGFRFLPGTPGTVPGRSGPDVTEVRIYQHRSRSVAPEIPGIAVTRADYVYEWHFNFRPKPMP